MDNSKPKAFIFMKVGDYGGETIEKILDRKNRELEGPEKKIFWGYGKRGPLHPTKQVKRFVELWDEEDGPIEVLMPLTKSNPRERDYLGTENWKEEYSEDGKNWDTVPPEICTDSDHALVLDRIRPCHFPLDLQKYNVGIGRSCGEKSAAEYLKGPNSRGCFVATSSTYGGRKALKNPIVTIAYRAYLKHPYAVFLR